MSDFSIQTLIAKSADFLAKKEVAGNHRLEAELLLGEILGVDRIKLILRANEQLTDDQINRYRQWVVRRSKNEPVAYILGYKEFLNERFSVNKDVLIPRPETEELCAWVLERYPKAAEVAKRKRNETEALDPKADFDFSTPEEYPTEESEAEGRTEAEGEAPVKTATIPQADTTAGQIPEVGLNVLDLATGSGCIGISMKKLRPAWNIFLSDVSEKALGVARTNWQQIIGNEPGSNIFVSDWFASAPDSLKGNLDLIISNPPYIAASEKPDIMPDVRDFEPESALFVNDPVEVLVAILNQAGPFLKPGGEIYLEAASPHLEKAAEAIQAGGNYSETELRKDEFGKLRFLRAKK